MTSMTRASLRRDLSELGLSTDDIVMVHASIRAVGPVMGGPDEIHHAIGDVVGPSGAMMMYVGCQAGFDDVGRGIYTEAEEGELKAHQPVFDPCIARAARDFGALAELFRTSPGVMTSNHACARMAARGGCAQSLLADHPWNYGFGAGSPLEKLCRSAGKVLLLGSDPDQVTLMHYAEHIALFEPKRVARYEVPLSKDGKRRWVPCEEYDTSHYPSPSFPERAYARIVEAFLQSSAGTARCRQGAVGQAECVLLGAQELVGFAVEMMIGWATIAAAGKSELQ